MLKRKGLNYGYGSKVLGKAHGGACENLWMKDCGCLNAMLGVPRIC